MNSSELAKMIDHSLLHPTMTDEDLVKGCEIARIYNTASVCIKPYAIDLALKILKDTDVAIGTVIGFPHGNSAVEVKVFEAEKAIRDGATEIDAVVNIGKVLGRDWDYVHKEIAAILTIVRSHNSILKLIFENDFLPADEYKIKLCEICSSLKVDYVKTSTGYGMVKGPDGKYSYEGATDHDLKLMRKYSSPEVNVKAAGGVRTLDDLLRVKSFGVKRAGATATEAIMKEAVERFGK